MQQVSPQPAGDGTTRHAQTQNSNPDTHESVTVLYRQHSDELDNYLDSDIGDENSSAMKKYKRGPEPNPVAAEMMIEEEAKIQSGKNSPERKDDRAAAAKPTQSAQPEMAITSNLTTLNIDGDNSSSDGAAPGGQGPEGFRPEALDEDELQVMKDKKYLDAFRKRQNLFSSENEKERPRPVELDQIEIDIQENSEPLSEEKFYEADAKLSVEISGRPLPESPSPEKPEKVELPMPEADEHAEALCSAIIQELIGLAVQEPKEMSVEEYHESLLSQPKDSKKKSPEKAEKKTGPSDVYSFISNSINSPELKHQIKQVVEMKQRHYIENDLIRTDTYINELLQYLLQFEVLTQHQLSGGDEQDYEELLQELGGVNYLVIFLKNLTQPVKRNLVDILQQYKQQEVGNYAHFESVQDPLRHPILPIDVYLDVEKHREFEFQMSQQQLGARNDAGNGGASKAYASGQSGTTVNTASIVQESQHILNKSIFDAMNESLTKFRPYGLMGEPLPWSNKYRRLQTDVDIHSVDTERLVQMVKQEVFRWMSTQQGALSHSHDSIFQFIDLQIPLMPELQAKALEKDPGEAPKEPTEKEDKLKGLQKMQDEQFMKFKKTLIEEATQEMRQAKLANQLHQEIIEDEHFWLNYEFEETQIRVDLSEMIFDQLMQETVDFLDQKQNSSKQKWSSHK